MLVLSRKIGERIIIGDAIVVTVLEVGHCRVRIGIDAPLRVNIRREEVRPRTVNRALAAPVAVSKN
jgi:carbon storage regulator